MGGSNPFCLTAQEGFPHRGVPQGPWAPVGLTGPPQEFLAPWFSNPRTGPGPTVPMPLDAKLSPVGPGDQCPLSLAKAKTAPWDRKACGPLVWARLPKGSNGRVNLSRAPFGRAPHRLPGHGMAQADPTPPGTRLGLGFLRPDPTGAQGLWYFTFSEMCPGRPGQRGAGQPPCAVSARWARGCNGALPGACRMVERLRLRYGDQATRDAVHCSLRSRARPTSAPLRQLQSLHGTNTSSGAACQQGQAVLFREYPAAVPGGAVRTGLW